MNATHIDSLVSYDTDEKLTRLERRYETVARSLNALRHEFELQSRAPVSARDRLAFLAIEIERFTRERRRLREQLDRLENDAG